MRCDQAGHKSQNKNSHAASDSGNPTANPRAKLRPELVTGRSLPALFDGSFMLPILSQLRSSYYNGLVS